jgi:hypothetical protein
LSGGWWPNAIIVELRGGARILHLFFISKVFVNFGGSGGMLPQEIFKFSTSETVSSGFWDPVFSDIHWIPSLSQI